MNRFILAAILALLLLGGCADNPSGSGTNGNGNDGSGTNPPPAPAPPTITVFIATPNPVQNGGTTTIAWETNPPADSCALKNDTGAQIAQSAGSNGSYATPPLTTTGNAVYALTCVNAGGSVAASLTVTVLAPPPPDSPLPTPPPTPTPPPSVTASAVTPIAYNGTSIITFSSANADSCTVNGTALGTSGTYITPPLTATAQFAVSCHGLDGSTVSVSVEVVVLPPDQPTATIWSDAPSVEWNGSTTIRWSAQNVLSCSVTGPNGVVSTKTSGIVSTGPLTANATYAITCTGLDGIMTVANSTTVTVGSQPAPNVTISTNKNPAPYGGPMRVSVTSTNAAWCSLKDEAGTEVATGTDGIAYTTPDLFGETASYAATCGNAGGTATASVTVPVQPMVEVSIGTVIGYYDETETSLFFLIRFWPKLHPISYYATNGIWVGITSENYPNWPGRLAFKAYPDPTDNTYQFGGFGARSIGNPDAFAMNYRVQVNPEDFEGITINQTLSLDTVIVPHALPWSSWSDTVYGDHVTVSFPEAAPALGYVEYIYQILDTTNGFCDFAKSLGHARGPHSPITLPVSLQSGVIYCSDLFGQNWESEPTSPSNGSVKKADPLPAYPLFSIGKRGVGFGF